MAFETPAICISHENDQKGGGDKDFVTRQKFLLAGVRNDYNEIFESDKNFKIETKMKSPKLTEGIMKHSIRRSFAALAIIMSFVLVQGAWAGPVIETLEGKVTTVDNRAIGLDTNNDDITDLTIYHMGPKWYWEDAGMSYPEIGFVLTLQAYDSLNGYIGVSVCYDDVLDECIQLRDPVTLKPLWIQNPETTDLSECLEGGDCEPVDNDYDNNYDYSYESKGPHKK